SVPFSIKSDHRLESPAVAGEIRTSGSEGGGEVQNLIPTPIVIERSKRPALRITGTGDESD
ncbi:MAG: hypothetical protein ACLFS4_04230, partial [Opitutales bacterium]